MTPPPYTKDLPLEEETIAEALSRAGYVTGFFGKWHVNEHYQRYLGWSPTHGPKAQGFDVAIEDFDGENWERQYPEGRAREYSNYPDDLV